MKGVYSATGENVTKYVLVCLWMVAPKGEAKTHCKMKPCYDQCGYTVGCLKIWATQLPDVP